MACVEIATEVFGFAEYDGCKNETPKASKFNSHDVLGVESESSLPTDITG